jgi:predicted O-methyltransferase YrrM
VAARARRLGRLLLTSDARLIRRAYRIGMTQKEREISGLLRMVRRLRPRAVLEIGTAEGGTLYLWTRASLRDAVVASIDLPAGGRDDPREAARLRRFARFARAGQRLHLLRADSHAADTARRLAALLGGRPLDFLFLDGDHSEAGVRRDFADYAPLVRPGGLVALHDIHPHSRGWGGGVPDFWSELRRRYPAVELIEDPGQDGFGIGVVVVPPAGCR